MFGPKSEEGRREAAAGAYQSTAKNFANVPEMSAEEAKRRLGDGEIVMVDVRSPKEQEVSMIEGAIASSHFEQHIDDYKGRTVVAYCTVGHRSGMFAQALIHNGWEAYNLEGAILGWVHEGGALSNGDGATKRVHVYNRRLRLLPEGYEAVW
jgi:rhodanese-related sulfurtransferase